MKKRNTFAGWQESKQTGREAIIDKFLIYLKNTRIHAAHPTALADLVARHISTVQGKPCATSTLMRNARYKTKILTHQAEQQAPGVKALDRRSVKDPTARALMTASELEASNLAREVERLRIYAKSLEEELDGARGSGHLSLAVPDSRGSVVEAVGVSDAELNFIRTCQALRSVVSHFYVVIELDTIERRILDKSKRRDNVIAGMETAAPFFDWLQRSNLKIGLRDGYG
jgi:hypothetical protein